MSLDQRDPYANVRQMLAFVQKDIQTDDVDELRRAPGPTHTHFFSPQPVLDPLGRQSATTRPLVGDRIVLENIPSHAGMLY